MKDTASKMSLDLDHLLFQDVHSCCQNTIYEATVSIKHIQTNLLLAFISDYNTVHKGSSVNCAKMLI